MRNKALEAEKKIFDAISYDLIPEAEISQYRAILEAITSTIEQEVEIDIKEALLDDILKKIERSRSGRIRKLEKVLTSKNLEKVSPESYRVIRNALDRNNLLAANEYLTLYQDGKELTQESGETYDFKEYFPDFALEMQDFTSGGRETQKKVADKLPNSSRIGALNLKNVPGAQKASAKKMLDCWLKAKNFKQNFLSLASELLPFFGFSVQNIEKQTKIEGIWTGHLNADPIENQDRCIIPRLGSQAGGRYRMMATWERISEDQIISAVSGTGTADPVLFLYFGQMSETRRRELAQLCRKHQKSIILIDELLVLYLCGSRGDRLPVLLQSALPFTVINPYITTAGLVPVEMFFGREKERLDVIDPYGTCLVFGGRQLGKTALLRHVERLYHKPSEGRIVKWVDLKPEGLGVNRPNHELWPILTKFLFKEGITKSPSSKFDTFRRNIIDWLNEDDKRRRIVLLLDEADAFLTADARGEGTKQWAVVHEIKGLMDQTARRFKVVFAGLHNVQRTSRDVNTPLAHLGNPICIGPLLDEGEWKDALSLVRRPLNWLGYQFESEDLPMRILSHTNFYPSLIQLFCKHLLGQLSNPKKTRFPIDKAPPFIIQEKHIDDAARDPDLRQGILNRFNWTLDLDTRYRVIALCIALEAAGDRSPESFAEGFDVLWVRKQALGWWQEGFENDSSIEAFRTILDEMVGIGILRNTAANRYALRSPNILNLIGTRDEIDGQLLDAIENSQPMEYDASTYRRTLAKDPWRQSPLTHQQESNLLGRGHSVSIIFGSKLAGLDDVREFLQAAAKQSEENSSFIYLESRDDTRSPLMIAQEEWEQKAKGHIVVLVSADSLRTRWVRESLEFRRTRKSAQKHIHIIFLVSPENSWKWMDVEGSESYDELIREGLVEHSLRPWSPTAFRRWLGNIQCVIPDEPETAEIFLESTGNWSHLVHMTGDLVEKNESAWKTHLRSIRDRLPSIQELGIIPETLTVLKEMTDYEDPIAESELAELMGRNDTGVVSRVIRWGDQLGFVQSAPGNSWAVDPIVSLCIQDNEPDER